jgi:hypothetical protein
MHGLWLDAAPSEGGATTGVKQQHFGGDAVHDRVVKVLVGRRARVHDVAARGGGGGECAPGHFYALFICIWGLRHTVKRKFHRDRHHFKKARINPKQTKHPIKKQTSR